MELVSGSKGILGVLRDIEFSAVSDTYPFLIAHLNLHDIARPSSSTSLSGVVSTLDGKEVNDATDIACLHPKLPDSRCA
jgi:hypothetical protein